MCLFGRQDDLLAGCVIPTDGISSRSVSEHISQLCGDANLEVLLTDDVDNLSVRFQRVKVTGEDISGVK